MESVKRCMHSAYVSKKSCPELTKALEHDMCVFGDMKRRAFAAYNTGHSRRDENGDSLHVRMKHEFGVSDYFANSAVQEAKAVFSSQKELAKMCIDDLENSIRRSEAKKEKLEGQLQKALALKKQIISATKKGISIRKSGISGVSVRKDGTFRVYAPGGEYTAYGNTYLFEHQWLDPRIAQLKSAVRNIDHRIRCLNEKTARLKVQIDAGSFSVRFGGQKMWHTEMPDSQRIRIMNQKKYGRMQISGRHDAKYGNFVFKYVTDDHVLWYTSMNGKSYDIRVLFPYGQGAVDASVGHGKACAWTVIDCGSAWRFDCVISYSHDGDFIDSYQHGCFGCDVNWDRIAVSETDGKGNFLREKDYRFHLEHLSSGAVTAALSSVLDEIFAEAVRVGKSLVFEDISHVKADTQYAGANRHISLFAYKKMRELILYKEQRFGISVRFVSPAYTSQTGKLKYMRRYGLSVHGSASFVIARRGLGFIDKVPKLPNISEKIFRLPRMKQWGRIYRKSKVIRPSDMTKPQPAF